MHKIQRSRLSPLATGPAQLARSAKDTPRQRKDIMGRKDVMHRTEGAVADLPAVKVRGIAVGGIAAGWVALRGAGRWSGSHWCVCDRRLAVGRLRVGNAAAKKLSVGRLEVDELVVGGELVRVEDLGPVIGSA
jgi:hypothetical protein